MNKRHNFMMTALVGLLVLGVSVPATALESPITQEKDSSEFEWLYEFEGNTAALLSEINLDGNLEGDFGDYQLWGTNSVQNGVMSMAVAETGGYNVFSDFSASFYPLIDTTLWRSNGFDRASGFTIETRLKVTSGEDEGPKGAFNLVAVPSDTSAAGGIHIGSNGQYWPSDGLPIGAQEDNTDDFHTFRIALETNPTVHLEKYSIWRDGVLISTGQAWGTGRSGMLSLGQADANIWGSVDIDYLRIDHGSWAPPTPTPPSGPINIGSQLEPMFDDYLIDQQTGSMELKLHQPIRHTDAVTLNMPWEGNNSNYATVLKDGDTYLLYYRGTGLTLYPGGLGGTHMATICVMTSTDGINWTRPDLGFVNYPGWEHNNVILTYDPSPENPAFPDGYDLLSGQQVPFTGAAHNFTPMIDTNPNCPPDEKFKAVGGVYVNRDLYAFKSPDGIHWSMMQEDPIITDGMLDSQNLVFWDPVQECYYAYYRDFKNKEGDYRDLDPETDFTYMDRDVRFATSTDFINWTPGEWIDWQPERGPQLYTSQAQLYPGNENLRIAFPARYIPDCYPYSSVSEPIAESSEYYASVYTDTGFATSRDGQSFEMWPEAVVEPPEDGWFYSFGFTALNLFEIPSEPDEWSLYILDHGAWFGDGVTFNRFSIRKDGFVSASATSEGGSFVTKPIIFDGERLKINFETSGTGSIQIEIQDIDGNPIPGFTLAECPSLFGDSIDYVVEWNSSALLSDLAGTPIRLHFVLTDADLYAFQFAILPLPGDADNNGTVDAADAAILASYWLTTSDATWEMGDFNGDGAVNDIDAAILAANWQVVQASASIPEPSSLILILNILGLAAFCGRARYTVRACKH